MRATRLLVEGAQEKIALSVRAGRGGPDLLDEGNIWEQLQWKFGDELGASFLDDQIGRLRYFDESCAATQVFEPGPLTPPAAIRSVSPSPDEKCGLVAEVLPTLDMGLGEAGALSEKSDGTVRDAAVTPTVDCTDSDASECEKAVMAPMLILDKYFVSTTGSARKLRLHLGGACWRVPGRDYATFVEFGDVQPGAGEYHAACRQCFPDGVPASSSDGSSVTSEAESLSS